MVRIGNVVRGNSKLIMRRSKTSVQLKTNAQKKAGMRSPNILGTTCTKDDLARRSLHTAHNESPNRRRSIDCTYHIWKLSDASEGMNNLKIIDVPLTARDSTRKSTNIFPPISNKSLRNPRLLSAKSTSSKNSPRKQVPNGIDYPNKPENNNIKVNDFMASERDNYNDFCHGLPNDTKQPLSDSRHESNKAVFTFGNKKNDAAANRSSHMRTSKLKASSLHSRSSEGSCNSTAFRAKFASRRRLSLPVNPTIPSSLLVPGKSREFHKAIKELSRQTDDSNGRLKRSQTVTSIMSQSDKLSTPPSSSTTRDAMSSHPISPGIRRDSLQRIEEIPTELQGTPVFSINEIPTRESDLGSGAMSLSRNNSLSFINEDTPYYNSADINTSSGDESRLRDQAVSIRATPTMPTYVSSLINGSTTIDPSVNDIDNIPVVENDNVDTSTDHNTNEHEDTIDEVAQNNRSKIGEFLNTRILIDDEDDDKSVIDASVLQEEDDDLCDADFREKRIIQWILTAETGDKVEQQVESSISPSPTNGSRETAITVIYSG
ncbi:uncharacterized protein LOC120328050 [Styela clava]